MGDMGRVWTRCPCGGAMSERRVEVTFADSRKLTDVPQMVCDSCGLRSYTTFQLETIESTLAETARAPRPRVW